ncbi:MAG: hypothetical protein R3E89_07770 [Thiolinea sp.]
MPEAGFGSLAFERRLPAAVLQEVRAQFDLPAEPALLWGMSMGGAVAVGTQPPIRNPGALWW